MKYLENVVDVYLKKSILLCHDFLTLCEKITDDEQIPYVFQKSHGRIQRNDRTSRSSGIIRKSKELSRFKRLRIKEYLDVDEVIEILNQCSDVETASKVVDPEVVYTPSDTTFGNCWYLKTSEYYSVNGEEAWDVEGVNFGEGIIVATIEPSYHGCRFTHEEFNSTGNAITDWGDIVNETHPCLLPTLYPDVDTGVPDYPEAFGHNTMTASDIVAKENGVGYAALANKAKVMLTYYQHGTDFDSIDSAIIRAVNQGADIISLSLMGNSVSTVASSTAVQYAIENGVFVVWAHGGNSDSDTAYDSIPETIAVSSHNSNGVRKYSYGTVDVSAPGIDIWRAGIMEDPGLDDTSYNNYYQYGSGNSNATPIVAAIVALIMKKNPTWNLGDIRQALICGCKAGSNQSIDSGGLPVWDIYYGWGCVDAKRSLDLTLEDMGVLSPSRFTRTTNYLYRIKFSWENTIRQTNYSHTIIVKKENSLPQNPTDGVVVYNGTGEETTDYVWMFDGEWYFSIYNVDVNGNYSRVYGDLENSPLSGKTSIFYHNGRNYISPVADFTQDVVSGIAPLTVVFDDSVTGRIDTTYSQWNFGDGGSSEERNPTHVFESGGVYTVAYTCGNPLETDTITKTNLIVVYTPVSAEFSVDITNGHTNDVFTFSDNSVGDYSAVVWDFGDDETSVEESPTHTYSQAGTYTISLTITGNGGTNSITKTNLITVQTYVNEEEPTVVADFYRPLVPVLHGKYVRFIDNSNGSVSSYKWSFGDGFTSVEQNPNHVFTKAGSYNVVLEIRGEDDSLSIQNKIVNVYDRTFMNSDILDVYNTSKDIVRNEFYPNILDYRKVKLIATYSGSDYIIYDGSSENLKGGYNSLIGIVTRESNKDSFKFLFYPDSYIETDESITIQVEYYDDSYEDLFTYFVDIRGVDFIYWVSIVFY